MKKLFFTAATGMLCFFISCKDESTSSTAGNDSNSKNLENSRKVTKAIETGDSAVINNLIADDAVDHAGPHGDVKGGDSVRHMLSDMHNHVKDLKMNIVADAANGDYVFSFNSFTGTASDASMGMPAGSKMDGKSVELVKVKDGKMVEHWTFVDPMEMMKQMQGMGADHSMDKMGADKMNHEKMNDNKMNGGKMDSTRK